MPKDLNREVELNLQSGSGRREKGGERGGKGEKKRKKGGGKGKKGENRIQKS